MVNYVYKYSESELREAVSASVSYSETLRKLGVPVQGNNSQTLKNKIAAFGIDTSHFTGRSRVNGVRSYQTSEEYIKSHGKNVKSCKLLDKLCNEGKKEKVCEVCGIKDWNHKPITFHLHHIDGNHANNSASNLQVLCPNCHSQTTNYKNKGEKKPKRFCKVCGRELKTNCASQMCLYCSRTHQRKVTRPPREVLESEVKELGYCATGRKYGVTDNAIRKWLKK